MMDAASKIAAGLVVSAALLVAGYIGYQEFARQRDISQAQAALSELAAQGEQLVTQAHQRTAASQQRKREAVALSWDRRLLKVGQRCVGGVVVEVEGSTYKQLGSIANPMHCSGRYADRPIR